MGTMRRPRVCCSGRGLTDLTGACLVGATEEKEEEEEEEKEEEEKRERQYSSS